MDLEEDGETKFCSNCKRDIAAQTFELHEVHCRRHITLCQVCGDPVPVKEQEEHFQEYHALEACDVCGQEVERDKLEDHKDHLCPERRVECKFCELDIKSRDFEQHVDNCGSRTDFCDRCMQRVMLKDMEEHKTLKCGRAHSSDEEVDPTLENIYPDTHGHGHFDMGLPMGPQDLVYGSVHYDEYDDEHLEEPVNDFQSNGVPVLEREFQPQDTSGGHSSVLVDQSWLDTVAEACGPDFDHILAQNMYYENMRQVSARDEYHGVGNGVLQEGVAANRQREEQSERQQNDADLARRLQSQFDNRAMEEQRDAELAQQLQQETPPPPYQALPPHYQAPPTHPAYSVEEDARLAQKLQEEEERHQRNAGGGAMLAQQLQEEEERRRMNKGGGVPGPDNEMVHQRVQLPDNEFYDDPPGGSYSIPHDPYSASSSLHPNPYDPHSSTPEFYSTAYRDDEQPRPKTPPPAAKKVGSKRRTHANSEDESDESEGKIPCQFCHHLFPFDEIMRHQQRCTADYSYTTCRRCGRVHPPPPEASTSSDYHYGNQRTVDVAALLRESSDSEDDPVGTGIDCRYCGHSYPSTCIMPHEALCERNPDKHLKDVYRSPRVDPPRPLVGGAGGGVTGNPKNVEIPCEFCGRKLKASVIHAHQPVCSKNPGYKVQRSERFGQTDEGQRSLAAGSAELPGVERGPCEFCGRLLPLVELVGHQATCQFHRSTGHLSTSPAHYTATSPAHHAVSSPTYTSPSHHATSNPLYLAAASTVHTSTNFAYPSAMPVARQNEPRPATPPPQLPKVAASSLVGSALYPSSEGRAATSLTFSCQTTSSPRVVDTGTRKRVSPRSEPGAGSSGSKVPRLSSDEDHSMPTGSQSHSSASYGRTAAEFPSFTTRTDPPLRSSRFSSSSQHYTATTAPSLTRPSPALPPSYPSHLTLPPSSLTLPPSTLTLPPSSLTLPPSTLTLPPSALPLHTLTTQPPAAHPSLSFSQSYSTSPAVCSASSTTKSFVPSARHQTTSSTSRLPETDLSRLPATDLSRLPATDLSRLPETDLSRLPATDLSRLPATDLSRLPETDLSRLPATDLSRLPATDLSRLPETDLSRLPETDLSPILHRPKPTLGPLSNMGLPRGSLSPTPSPTIASETYPSIPSGPHSPLASSATVTQGPPQPTSQLYSKAEQYSKDEARMKKGSEELRSLLRITHNPSIASGSVATDFLTQSAPKTSELDHPSSRPTARSYGGGGVVKDGTLSPPLKTSVVARDHSRAHTADTSRDPAGSGVESDRKWSGSASQRPSETVPATEGLESRLAGLTLSPELRHTSPPYRAQLPVVGSRISKSHGVKQSPGTQVRSNPKPRADPKPQPSRLPKATPNLKITRRPSPSSSVETSGVAPKPKPRASTATSKQAATATKPSTSNRSISQGNSPRTSGRNLVTTGKSTSAQPRSTTATGRKNNTSPRTSISSSKGRTVSQPSRTTASVSRSPASKQQTTTHQNWRKY